MNGATGGDEILLVDWIGAKTFMIPLEVMKREIGVVMEGMETVTTKTDLFSKMLRIGWEEMKR